MAVSADGDVPPTLLVVMGNPGDQAGLIVHEFEGYVHEEVVLGMWLSIMWILISVVISYGFYTMKQIAFSNEETGCCANIFEEHA